MEENSTRITVCKRCHAGRLGRGLRKILDDYDRRKEDEP